MIVSRGEGPTPSVGIPIGQQPAGASLDPPIYRALDALLAVPDVPWLGPEPSLELESDGARTLLDGDAAVVMGAPFGEGYVVTVSWGRTWRWAMDSSPAVRDAHAAFWREVAALALATPADTQALVPWAGWQVAASAGPNIPRVPVSWSWVFSVWTLIIVGSVSVGEWLVRRLRGQP